MTRNMALRTQRSKQVLSPSEVMTQYEIQPSGSPAPPQSAPSRQYLAASEIMSATGSRPTSSDGAVPGPGPATTSSSSFDPAAYTKPFMTFMTQNPTVFHAVSTFAARLVSKGFTHLSERDDWELKKGGKYFITRNGSGLIAFVVGQDWSTAGGAAIIASHVDALTTKVKPISTKPNKNGFMQLGVAHYGGALNQTWIDRDLGIGGRVFVKDSKTGKITSKLVKIGHPIARIPSIAPHFGIAAEGQANRETRMVPIVGLDNSDISASAAAVSELPKTKEEYGFGFSAFASTQPPRLLKAIAEELDVSPGNIVNWELEVFDTQPAQVGGLDKEFIFAGRIDDKMCSYAAIEALLASTKDDAASGLLKVVGLFDDEEVGSLMRQGANSNFLPGTIARINEAFGAPGTEATGRTFAKSFMISAGNSPESDDLTVSS